MNTSWELSITGNPYCMVKFGDDEPRHDIIALFEGYDIIALTKMQNFISKVTVVPSSQYEAPSDANQKPNTWHSRLANFDEIQTFIGSIQFIKRNQPLMVNGETNTFMHLGVHVNFHKITKYHYVF